MLTSTPPFCAAGGETLAPANFDDFNFHGTHVGGIVNTNGIGTAGVAPHSTLVVVKVLNCAGFGSFIDIIHGILYAASIPVDVINMSLGADVPNTPATTPLLNALTAAVQVAVDAGVYVVASAGNSARQLPEVEGEGELVSVPRQSHPDLACVSATGPFAQTNFDALASYSNFGEEAISVAAPGGDFLALLAGLDPFGLDLIISPCSPSAIPNPGGLPFVCSPFSYVSVAGTSQAAPHVSGTGAMVKAQTPSLSGEDLKEIIEDSTDEVGSENTHGEGRINIFSAVTDD